jgi:hypothetical protein
MIFQNIAHLLLSYNHSLILIWLQPETQHGILYDVYCCDKTAKAEFILNNSLE